ncbi:MAG: Bug family tripartite tricarboxylate transporter substrate binding protein, partial [Bacteroidota bacterium]
MRVTKQLLIGIGLAIACAGATAQPYPSKPIRFVVATAAGGASDIVARTIAERMQEGLGQPIVVEAKPGANGNLAAEYVARSAPDGYTMMMGTIGVMAINVSMYRKTPFDPLTDFAAVASLVSFSNMLVVR